MLQKDLPAFLHKIRSLGYKIKLDTNGTSPDKLKELMDQNLLDYIAMDIKNSKEKYSLTTGIVQNLEAQINHSIEYVMNSSIDYEFRTTVTRELHKEEDILAIAKWIQGAKAYYLQPYRNSPQVIKPVYSSYSSKELEHFLEVVSPYVEKCSIIG